MIIKTIFAALALSLWFSTQRLIGKRKHAERLTDKIHNWSAPAHGYLKSHPQVTRNLLVISSAVIDLLGVSLLFLGILGPSSAPLIGLTIVFVLRQLLQFLVILPPPQGMIWHNPGVPSLLVTYGVSTDLFFSGHSALAVYGGLQLWHTQIPFLQGLGAAIMVFQTLTVLMLRAHWTMDVYAAIVTAVLADILARRWAPALDSVLATWSF